MLVPIRKLTPQQMMRDDPEFTLVKLYCGINPVKIDGNQLYVRNTCYAVTITRVPRIKATSFEVPPRFSGMLQIFAECTVNLIQGILVWKKINGLRSFLHAQFLCKERCLRF